MAPKELSALFAANVRALLAAREWSQNHLADLLGIKSGTASRLLSGDHVPSGATLSRVADVLGVQPHELLMPAKRKK